MQAIVARHIHRPGPLTALAQAAGTVFFAALLAAATTAAAELPADEIATLTEWVKRGAPDPRQTTAADA